MTAHHYQGPTAADYPPAAQPILAELMAAKVTLKSTTDLEYRAELRSVIGEASAKIRRIVAEATQETRP